MPDLKMPQLNHIAVTARLLRDPELKFSASGMAFLKTGIAIDDGFGDKKKSYFVDIAAFGKLAERMHPELSRGVPVIVEGRLTVEEWEAKDGTGKRSRVVILASRIDRITWPEKSEYTQDGNDTPRPPQTPPRPTQTAGTPIPEDDIPF